VLTLVLAVAFASGCRPADRDVRLARLDAQRRGLDSTFDQLEARLTASQARVRFWNEIRERHESVSAVACVSQEEHAEEMAKHGIPSQPQRRARVATASRPHAPVRVPAATVQARTQN
jgi:hypothetical protein